MNKKEYMKNEHANARVIRGELISAPLLVLFPLIVGFFFIYDWYSRGFIMGDSAFNVELMLGIIIIVGNVIFDIPFIRTLKSASKKK
jgi:hypothetical protein